ncbi:hypothetical protein GF373_10295 [bacterium]|nr:hypothetical protein [bacterium]
MRPRFVLLSATIAMLLFAAEHGRAQSPFLGQWAECNELCQLFLTNTRLITLQDRSSRLENGEPSARGKFDVESVARRAAKRQEDFWQRIQRDPIDGRYTSRTLFNYALALCEANLNLDRLDRLFELAARVQQRDPDRNGYGNFFWYSDRPEVKDRNAVEFCMEPGTLIWLRHRENLSDVARRRLHELMRYSMEACMRRNVGPNYTNISLMNAGNLIRLGELLDRPKVAAEGYQRLETFCINTWLCGINEYVSPTYYRVDLTCLQLLERFSEREMGRQQARALLRLFWTDVVLNWFNPAERLAGTASRTYDYLLNTGGIHSAIAMHGWLDREADRLYDVPAALGRWKPDEDILHRRHEFPRLVQQRWGPEPRQHRTHQLYKDITLSSSGALYYAMDVPLSVDWPGANRVRGYFIPDGRNDPYGKKKYDTGSGHHKARHLIPFWTAAQRQNDAVGVCIYQSLSREFTREELDTLKSHFVLPNDVRQVWIGHTRIDVNSNQGGVSARHGIPSGKALILRHGSAAMGLRIVAARQEDGKQAPAALVTDGNAYGAMRLEMNHVGISRTEPGMAALWIRVGSGLESDKAFEQWQSDFANAKADVTVNKKFVKIAVPGKAGAVAVEVEQPWAEIRQVVLKPKMNKGILRLNGQAIGRDLLGDGEPFSRMNQKLVLPEPFNVPTKGGCYIEAEAGLVIPPFHVEKGKAASGGEYIKARSGGNIGAIRVPLRMPRAGKYYLWGRVFAPSKTTDSFFARVMQNNRVIIPAGEWHTGNDQQWRWAQIELRGHENPATFALPKGELELQLRGREAGTSIDRLFITNNASARPE